MGEDFSKRILVSITGRKNSDWKKNLEEIRKYKLSKVALFLECFDASQRKKLYPELLASRVKEIPLVHLRNDMKKEEIDFLIKNYHPKYLTIHEDTFKIMKKWKSYYKYLYLEMDANNFVSKTVDVHKIGGFCVDLAHFKREEESWSKEFEYIIKRRNVKRYFACNHLNGYSYKRNIDLHTIKSLHEFNYLKTLPEFLFSDNIAIETFNSITEQLKFKKYLIKLLNSVFNK